MDDNAWQALRPTSPCVESKGEYQRVEGIHHERRNKATIQPHAVPTASNGHKAGKHGISAQYRGKFWVPQTPLMQVNMDLHKIKSGKDDEEEDDNNEEDETAREVHLLEKKFRSRYTLLQKSYEERLKDIAQLLSAKIIHTLQRDESLQVLMDEKMCQIYLPQRVQEVILDEINMDKEAFIASLMQKLSKQQSEHKFKHSQAIIKQQQQIKKLQQSLENHSIQNKELYSMYVGQEHTLEEVQKINEELKQELQQFTELHGEWDKTKNEILSDLHSKNEHLRQYETDFQKLHEQIRVLEEKNEEYQADEYELKLAYEKACFKKEELSVSNAKQEQIVADQASKIEALTKQFDDLRQKCGRVQLQTSGDVLDYDDVTRLQKLNLRNQELINENEKLSAKYQQLDEQSEHLFQEQQYEHEQIIEKIHTKYKKAKQTIKDQEVMEEQLRSKISSLEAELQKAHDTTKEVESTKHKLEKQLASTVMEWKEAQAKATQKMLSLEDEIEHLALESKEMIIREGEAKKLLQDEYDRKLHLMDLQLKEAQAKSSDEEIEQLKHQLRYEKETFLLQQKEKYDSYCNELQGNYTAQLSKKMKEIDRMKKQSQASMDQLKVQIFQQNELDSKVEQSSYFQRILAIKLSETIQNKYVLADEVHIQVEKAQNELRIQHQRDIQDRLNEMSAAKTQEYSMAMLNVRKGISNLEKELSSEKEERVQMEMKVEKEKRKFNALQEKLEQEKSDKVILVQQIEEGSSHIQQLKGIIEELQSKLKQEAADGEDSKKTLQRMVQERNSAFEILEKKHLGICKQLEEEQKVWRKDKEMNGEKVAGLMEECKRLQSERETFRLKTLNLEATIQSMQFANQSSMEQMEKDVLYYKHELDKKRHEYNSLNEANNACILETKRLEANVQQRLSEKKHFEERLEEMKVLHAKQLEKENMLWEQKWLLARDDADEKERRTFAWVHKQVSSLRKMPKSLRFEMSNHMRTMEAEVKSWLRQVQLKYQEKLEQIQTDYSAQKRESMAWMQSTSEGATRDAFQNLSFDSTHDLSSAQDKLTRTMPKNNQLIASFEPKIKPITRRPIGVPDPAATQAMKSLEHEVLFEKAKFNYFYETFVERYIVRHVLRYPKPQEVLPTERHPRHLLYTQFQQKMHSLSQKIQNSFQNDRDEGIVVDSKACMDKYEVFQQELNLLCESIYDIFIQDYNQEQGGQHSPTKEKVDALATQVEKEKADNVALLEQLEKTKLQLLQLEKQQLRHFEDDAKLIAAERQIVAYQQMEKQLRDQLNEQNRFMEAQQEDLARMKRFEREVALLTTEYDNLRREFHAEKERIKQTIQMTHFQEMQTQQVDHQKTITDLQETVEKERRKKIALKKEMMQQSQLAQATLQEVYEKNSNLECELRQQRAQYDILKDQLLDTKHLLPSHASTQNLDSPSKIGIRTSVEDTPQATRVHTITCKLDDQSQSNIEEEEDDRVVSLSSDDTNAAVPKEDAGANDLDLSALTSLMEQSLEELTMDGIRNASQLIVPESGLKKRLKKPVQRRFASSESDEMTSKTRSRTHEGGAASFAPGASSSSSSLSSSRRKSLTQSTDVTRPLVKRRTKLADA